MRSRAFLLLPLAAVLLAAPVLADDGVEEPKSEDIVELECALEEAVLGLDETTPATPVASLGLDGTPEVLGCVVKTCDDYPSTPWSTCSCTSQLIRKRCQRSCDKKKGQVLETTCTINQGCASPPCEILPPIVRTSLSCALVP